MYVEVIDNILDEEILGLVDSEINTINWSKEFTRAGSLMLENNDIESLPVMASLYMKFSTPSFLRSLSDKLGVDGICPDPFMVGAGYSEIKDSNDLKPHVDFNWNDDLKLHRVASLIIYLTDIDSGGELEFENKIRFKPSRNRAILFEHSEDVRHWVNPTKEIRRCVRFFYYASKLNSPEGYHRSLYGYENGKPVDV